MAELGSDDEPNIVDLSVEEAHMPLGTWLMSWFPVWTRPIRERGAERQVLEIIFGELSWQIRSSEERYVQLQQEERKQKRSGFNYTWLAMSKLQFYTIPEDQRLELEDLCRQIVPGECSHVIRLFRRAALREPPVQELPIILRAVLKGYICERPEVATTSVLTELSRWIVGSVQNFWFVRLGMFSNSSLKSGRRQGSEIDSGQV